MPRRQYHLFVTGLPKAALAVLLMISLTACASTLRGESRDDGVAEEQAAAPSGSSESINDPFEDLNRRIFVFNYRLDRAVLKPVAEGYRDLTPRFVQTGVSNFFSNLKEVNNSANSALQWKWGQAGNDGARFLVNSTLGLVGLFDVASEIGLSKNAGEDFGQTLAVWGVGQGPYLMVPVLGPYTLRDSVGGLVDQRVYPVSYVNPWEGEWGLRALDSVDRRAHLLQNESLLTGDNYVLLRDFYLQSRNYQISDGEVEDDFGDDYGDDGDYYYDDYGSGDSAE